MAADRWTLLNYSKYVSLSTCLCDDIRAVVALLYSCKWAIMWADINTYYCSQLRTWKVKPNGSVISLAISDGTIWTLYTISGVIRALCLNTVCVCEPCYLTEHTPFKEADNVEDFCIQHNQRVPQITVTQTRTVILAVFPWMFANAVVLLRGIIQQIFLLEN